MRDETQKKWPSLNPRINDHLMIQQRSLLQSDSREVHVGHYHLFFTKASGSKLSFANFRIESTEKKRQKTSLPVFQLPPGLSFHIGSPFASPVGVPDPKRSHNALEPSVPHLLARSSSANVHCSGRSSQIFPPQQHGMTQLISSWNSANLWCFSSISDKIPSFLASN